MHNSRPRALHFTFHPPLSGAMEVKVKLPDVSLRESHLECHKNTFRGTRALTAAYRRDTECFPREKGGPKVAFLLVTFAVLAEMCVLYRTSHVRIPRSLEEYKDHGDLLTDERN